MVEAPASRQGKLFHKSQGCRSRLLAAILPGVIDKFVTIQWVIRASICNVLGLGRLALADAA